MEKENSTKTNLSSPKISCIVPVYNVEKYLNRCIDSILAQTFTDFELILIDDGSPDNCGRICDEYAEKDSRIRVIHKPNGGVSSARNAGLDAARGEFVCFVDSDDWVEADYMRAMYEVAIETGADVIGCNLINDFYKRQINYIFSENTIENLIYLLQNKLTGAIYNQLIRLNLLKENHIIFDTSIAENEDWLFSFKVFLFARIVRYVNLNLYYYNYINLSSATKSFSYKKLQDMMKALTEAEKFFFEKYPNIDFSEYFIERRVYIKNSGIARLPIKELRLVYNVYCGLSKKIRITDFRAFYNKLKILATENYFLFPFILLLRIRVMVLKKFRTKKIKIIKKNVVNDIEVTDNIGCRGGV